LEGLPEEGTRIQAGDHVVERFCLLYGHAKESEELRAGVVVFLVFIGVERRNGTIQEVQAELPEEVHNGKSFKEEDFLQGETSSS